MAKIWRSNFIMLLVGLMVVTVISFLYLRTNTDSSKSTWSLYTNSQYKFSLMYPQSWVVEEFDKGPDGYIVSIYSPDKIPLRKKGPIVNTYTDNIAIRVFDSINNPDAKGGEGIGEPIYGNLEEFFADKEHYHPNRKIGETYIDGRKMYEIISGGNGQLFALIMENEDGSLLEIEFPTSWDKSKLSETERQILSTFKFLK